MDRRERLGWAAVVALAAAALVLGWRTFWFLCDDAYIAFRYVSNSQLGHGYVWNPPPFRPVEGYTSFLWVVILDLAWTLTGLDPTKTANVLSLAASFGMLAIVVMMTARLPLSERLAPWRVLLLGLVLLATLSNRTFLAWTSSGLETALFGLLLLGWLYVGLRPPTRGRLFGLSLLAALLELTRPDGLLFLAATAAVLALHAARRAGHGELRATDALPWVPFAIPVAHEAWRLWFYGFPLPNTAYAKITSPWPDMGLVYLLSFVLEYGYVVVIGLAVAALVRWARAGAPLGPLTVERLGRAVVIAALVGQVAYYTLIVGGDHFEYRVYQPLVPLLALGTVWLADRLGFGWRRTLAAFVVTFALGWPLPWVHWYHTHTITERYQNGMPDYRVAKHFPPVLRTWAWAWDELQHHLIRHFVGMRHQTHVIYGMHYQPSRWPTREEGEKIVAGPDGPKVLVHASVGYPAWVLPHVAILDYRGLNDIVVARTPPRSGKRRLMAHERQPPRGYTACFRPNVVERDDVLHVEERSEPLTDDEIRTCEAEWFAKVTNAGR